MNVPLLCLTFLAFVNNNMQNAIADDNPPIFLDHGIKPGSDGCVDMDKKCPVWASQGECQNNAAWMMANCRKSCNSCQGGAEAWKLRNEIAEKFNTNGSDGSGFTLISVNIKSTRLDHVEVDEKAQTMTIHGRLVTTWNETKLKWDKEKWGISWLNFYWLQIWTPQIVQTNSPKTSNGKTDSKILAANYTGQGYMWTDFTFSAPCQFDYSSYPRDRQTCCFEIDDKRYYSVRFHVSGAAQKSLYSSAETTHVSGWEARGATIEESPYSVKVLSDWAKDSYDLETTNAEICVEIQRKAGYFSAEISGPAVATAVITLSSFIVGTFWNQILLLICSLAIQIVCLFIVNSKLPPSSGGMPKVVTFYSFNLATTTLLIIISCFLLNLSTLRSIVPPPHCFQRLMTLMQKVLPCVNMDTDESKFGDPSNESSDGGTVKCFWAPVAKAVKYLLFLICLVLYVLVMIGCLSG